MSRLDFVGFKGIMSEISPKLLPDGYSVQCTNCFLDDGSCDAWKGLDYVLDLGKSGTINSLHLINNVTWLHYTEEVQFALATIANNDDHYTVITGLDQPRYTNKNLATSGGGTTWPKVTYHLGFPSPSLKPTVSVNQQEAEGVQFQWAIAGTEADDIGNKLTYSYVYTFADESGREGPPSPVSDLVYASTDDKITLSNLDILTGVYPAAGEKRIYRSEAGGPYLYLTAISYAATTFIDIFSFVAGDAIETTLWSAPPTTLTGSVTMANGMMVGYVGNDLYISEPYQPHAWPTDYIQHVDYPIKGIASAGNMLMITTEKYPYIAVGNHPSIMTLTKLETIQANMNLRSLIDIGEGAMFASEDGIVMVSGAGANIITKDVVSEKMWKALDPSSIHAVYYREKYFGFYNSGESSITTENGEIIPGVGSFLFDLAKKQITFSDVYGTAAYSDVNTGELYLVQDDGGVNKVYKWNSNATKLSKVWTSKPRITKEIAMTAARLELLSGSVTFKLYADGVLKHTETVSDDSIFRLPSGYLAREWYIELSGSGIVDAAYIASNVSEL